MSETYVPPGHEGITIDLHRLGGKPCLAGTRLPASIVPNMRAQGYQDAVIREWWPDITLARIDAALRWYDDPDHERVTKNAIRRQKYAERREMAP